MLVCESCVMLHVVMCWCVSHVSCYKWAVCWCVSDVSHATGGECVGV